MAGMVVENSAETATSLQQMADRNLRQGDPRAASEQFVRAIALAPDRLDLRIGLAAARKAMGDFPAALAAVEGALALEPRFLPGLLMMGSLLESMGLEKQAAMVFGNVLKVAPPLEALTEPLRRALEYASVAHARYVHELVVNLTSEVNCDGVSARRAHAFIEALAGRRKVFHQEPVKFHYPGLPAIEFYEREQFPWLGALEAYTDAIRTEALAVCGEGSAGITPYVNYPVSAPLDQWSELNRSPRWSAFHLFKGGDRVTPNCVRCPSTMAALDIIDQPWVRGHSPAAMFSILSPRTRIPPHTGISNTRLVLHLPLVVPEGCGFRVGSETRPWREGEAWVFDDTIEHEAWNDSDLPRIVMICDVWSPFLTPEERDLVSRIHAALDRFNGEANAGAGL